MGHHEMHKKLHDFIGKKRTSQRNFAVGDNTDL
jgi:hypothetical protein